jgi:L-histidine Nalpha-methyltransferase
VRETLFPGDALLLGTDLEKAIPQMIRAYDDSIGVTAAFNLNLLARINRELDGDFVVSQFRHVARYDKEHRRMEMHLLSTVTQAVTIRKAGLTVRLREGETIWTESSHKYNREEVVQMAERTGFHCDGQWVDLEWPFAQSLFIAL